jgi:hypothetical protein
MPKWERKPLEIGRTEFKPTLKNLQFFFMYQSGMEVLLKKKNYATLVKTKCLTIGITILILIKKEEPFKILELLFICFCPF